MNRKFTSTIIGAVILISVVNLISRGLGFFREVLYANYFGLSIQFDVYLVAAVLPITINTILLYIGQNYFIPAYNNVKIKNPDGLKNFVKTNVWIFSISTFLIAGTLYIFSGFIIKTYLGITDLEIINDAIIIFKIFLITIPLHGFISLLVSYNQAKQEFKYPALSRLFLNLGIIPILIIFSSMLGIYVIPIGYLVGVVLQLTYLIVKSKVKVSLDSLKPDGSLRAFEFFDLTIIGVILIETIGQLYLMTDRYFFNQVSQGGISALNYAMNMFVLPLSIFSFALTTVIFPKFSVDLQNSDYSEFRKTFSDSIRITLLLFVPLAFIYFFYSEDIIRVIFERGKFSSSDSYITSQALSIYAISILFYAVYSIINKVMYGAKLVKTLLIISFAGLVIKILLNFLLVNNYEQNGLAFATTSSFIFYFISGIIVLYAKVPVTRNVSVFKEIFLYLVNGFVTYLLLVLISDNIALNSLTGSLIHILLFLFIFTINLYWIDHNSVVLIKRVLNSFWTNNTKLG